MFYELQAGDARVMLQYLTDRMYDEVRGPGQFRPREDRGHFFLKLLLYKQNFEVLYSILFLKTSLFYICHVLVLEEVHIFGLLSSYRITSRLLV
jgi:hypothetical protein